MGTHLHFTGISITKIYNRTKVEVPEMMGRCSFNTEVIPCDQYMTPVLTHMGQCYTFNSLDVAIRNISTFRPGVINGLQMQIFIDQDQYFTGTYSAGLKVYTWMNNNEIG